MFEVDCLDTYDNPIEHFTQWDVDQKVKIVLDGVEDGYLAIAPEVHFANAKSTEALVVRSTVQGNDTIIANVPNVLLQAYYPLLIYVYLTDSKDVSSQKTIIKIEIPVRKRAVPSDYEYVENIERITAEQIKQEIKDELSEDMAGSTLTLTAITFEDVVTGILHKLYVSNGKLILENLGTSANRIKEGNM